MRLLTKARLNSLYRILEAENGDKALEILDHEHVDLPVADIQMPKMNGYGLVRALRESGYDTPVIMLTAMTSFANKERAFCLRYRRLYDKTHRLRRAGLAYRGPAAPGKIAHENKIAIGRFSMSLS